MQNQHTENYSDKKSTGKLIELRDSLLRNSRRVALYIFCFAVGYLMSSLSLPFGTYPLGIAVLAAATKGVPFLLFGAMTGAMLHTPHPIIYICTLSALVLMRMFLNVMSEHAEGKKGGLFSDKLPARVFSVTLISIVTGVYTLISGGFRYFDLIGVFFGLAASILATMVFSLAFDGELSKGLLKRGDKLSVAVPYIVAASKLCFAFALIYSARKLNLGVISISAASAFFITLYVGKSSLKTHALIKSAICGLVLGFAVSTAVAPLYMLAGVVSAMLYSISPLSAVISACLCGSVWGTYIGGTNMLIFLLPSMVLAGTLLLIWDKLERTVFGAQVSGKTASSRADMFERGTSEANERRLFDRDEQIAALSGAFSSLSDILYNLSDKLRRPGILDLGRICDGAFDIYCPKCPDRELCWGLEYSSTLEILGGLSEHLHTHGRVDISCMPEKLIERCPNVEEIISEINRSCARMTEVLLRGEKTEVFALDYEGMARILCDTLSSEESEYDNNSALAAEISQYLYECGFGQTSVVCFGGRRKQIIARGIGPFRAAIYSEHLREDIERISGYQLVGPTFEHGDGYAPQSMVFTARPKFSAECVMRTLAADSEDVVSRDLSQDHVEPDEKETSDAVCGDTVNVFMSNKDYLYALISDGMGTGSDAAFTSELCSVFLEKMLSAGNSVDTTLKMLNGIVRSKSSLSASAECSASVDLLELDLLCGSVGFIKSGAVQSYILRDGEVLKFSSNTVPIGIIRSLDAERQKAETKVGDIILMISDGVTQGSDDGDWICDILAAEDGTGDLGELAEKIIREARHMAKLRGYEKYDDASVVCVRISDYKDGN